MSPSVPVRRPGGVIFSAVLLGLLSGLLVLFGLGSALMGVAMKSLLGGRMATTSAQAPPPGAMTAVFVVIGLLYLVLAAWGTATVVGLVRMHNWARISSIVIGAGLSLFGLLAVAGTLVGASMLNSQQVPTAASPQAVHAILMAYVVLEVLLVAAGLWLFIYFLLRPTREAFRTARNPVLAPVDPYAFPAAYATPSPYASAPVHSESLGATDFQYAEPLPPSHVPTEHPAPVDIDPPSQS